MKPSDEEEEKEDDLMREKEEREKEKERSTESVSKIFSNKIQRNKKNSTSINEKTRRFLSTWYYHIKKYSTQDQISFPFVSQQLHIHPYSLPSEQDGIYGNLDFNSLYIKLEHGL
jgi:hypothetical protein